MNSIRKKYRDRAAKRFASMVPEHEGKWVLYDAREDRILFMSERPDPDQPTPLEPGYHECFVKCEEMELLFDRDVTIYKLGGNPPLARGYSYVKQCDGSFRRFRSVFRAGQWTLEDAGRDSVCLDYECANRDGFTVVGWRAFRNRPSHGDGGDSQEQRSLDSPEEGRG